MERKITKMMDHYHKHGMLPKVTSKADIYKERSGHKMKCEIEYYEKQNESASVNVYTFEDKSE